MELSELTAWADLAATIAVFVSLVYLALQVRESNRVNKAVARHSLQQFALDMTIAKTDHVDRLARLYEPGDAEAGDRQFLWQNHMMVFLHAETYHRHFELGFMPHNHWIRYLEYIRAYMEGPGVRDFWAEVGGAFSPDFAKWIDGLDAPVEGE